MNDTLEIRETDDNDTWHMLRALELAARGRGLVEPNPMVGCVLVRDGQVVGEGWHKKFGGPHAEVEALARAGLHAAGSTLYVTLEPCCHHGKTPPCTAAILRAGVRRVVAAISDPFPAVAGGGLAALRSAGIETQVGLLESDARQLAAPYLKLLTTRKPWIIAKWAMTLDGKIATRSGNSRWISSSISRNMVQRLRGRVDAILIGSGTALADDPLLTARPESPATVARVATRIVVDSRASLGMDCQLVRTARQAPVMVAVSESAELAKREQLVAAGCEVLVCDGADHGARLESLLVELGRRKLTNVLVEGGGRLLGGLLDVGQIDEVHVFVAPKLIGGQTAPGPIAGMGLPTINAAWELDDPVVETIGSDLYLHGRLRRPAS